MSSNQKRLFAFCAAVVFVLSLSTITFAAHVPLPRAKRVAINWVKKVTQLAVPDISIAETYVERAENIALYYVFNIEPAGYVIVSADDVCHPILGYSLNHAFEKSKLPPALDDWLKYRKNEALFVIKSKVPRSAKNDQKWQQLDINSLEFESQFFSNILDRTFQVKAVSPLLDTLWAQGRYYNTDCPVDASGPDGHAVVGCVATAMGQILRYWSYPTTGTGINSYNHPVYGIQTANFGLTTYNWAGMPLGTLSGYDADVAQLLYHCGVSVEMDYGPGVSLASTSHVVDALNEYFRYSRSANYVIKSLFPSDNAWDLMLRTELDYGRPLQYRGSSSGGAGHSFVIDGYQETDYFHINWGWEWGDYYYLQSTTPLILYPNGQAAIKGIIPSSFMPDPWIHLAGDLPDQVMQGDYIELDFTSTNYGENTSDSGGITLSFPNFTNSNDHIFLFLEDSSSGTDYTEYPMGQPIWHKDGYEMSANYLMAEMTHPAWAAGSTKGITLRVYPQQLGTFTILARSAMGYHQAYANHPVNSSYSDQQGWEVYRYTVNVVPPQPDIRTPISGIGFGTVTVGNTSDQTTTIYNDGTAALTVNSISRSSGSSDFTYIGPSTPFSIPASGSRTITVRFAPSSAGSKNATFNVNSNDPDESNVPFSVSGTGEVALEPDIRTPIPDENFGDRALGASSYHAFPIYNDGTATLTINSITRTSGSSDFIFLGPTTPFTIPASSYLNITVEFSPTSVGPKSAIFNVNSNDPDEPNVPFTTTGTGIPALEPDIRAPISGIGFGTVTVGNTSDLSTTIFNDGTAALTVNSISRSSGSSDFTYIGPSTPFSIPASGSRTITVRFAPSSAGSKNATFNVNSNDPDEANVPFSVSGTGEVLPEPILSVTPTERNVSWEAGTTTFDVSNAGTGTMNWTAEVTRGAGWFSIQSGSSGVNSGTITVTFPENTISEGPIGIIQVTAPGAEGSPKSAFIFQAPKPMNLSVTPDSRNVSYNAGTTTFFVDNTTTGPAMMEWSASVISGGSWLSILSGSSGMEEGTITAEFTQNTSTSPRQGTIRVTAPYATGSPKDVFVFQGGISIFPEIHITVDDDPVPDGEGVDFGSHMIGTTTDMTFVVANIGSANLTLSGSPIITISGPNASQYSVVQQPASPIAAGSSTTFVIRFSPTTQGGKTAFISIENNDSNEDPYDITLFGIGTAIAKKVLYLKKGDKNPDDYDIMIHAAPTKVGERGVMVASDYWSPNGDTRHVTTIDIDNDGVDEIAYLKKGPKTATDNDLFIYTAPTKKGEKGTYLASDYWRANGEVIDIAAIDINGDGVDEIAYLKKGPKSATDHDVFIYTAPTKKGEKGTYLASDYWSANGDVVDIAAIDVDGDGRDEIAYLKKGNKTADDYDLFIYTAPTKVGERGTLIASDYWRPNGKTINISSLDLDGDDKDEIVYLKKGNDSAEDYNLYIFTAPTSVGEKGVLRASDLASPNGATKDQAGIII